MSARTSTLKRPRNLSPTATLNVMNSNSNSGMNSNTNADNSSPLAKRLKTIREVNSKSNISPPPLKTPETIRRAMKSFIDRPGVGGTKRLVNVNNTKFLAAQSAARLRSVKATPVKATPVKATPVKATPVKAKPVKAKPVKAKPVKAKPGTAKKIRGAEGKKEAVNVTATYLTTIARNIAKNTAPSSSRQSRTTKPSIIRTNDLSTLYNLYSLMLIQRSIVLSDRITNNKSDDQLNQEYVMLMKSQLGKTVDKKVDNLLSIMNYVFKFGRTINFIMLSNDNARKSVFENAVNKFKMEPGKSGVSSLITNFKSMNSLASRRGSKEKISVNRRIPGFRSNLNLNALKLNDKVLYGLLYSGKVFKFQALFRAFRETNDLVKKLNGILDMNNNNKRKQELISLFKLSPDSKSIDFLNLLRSRNATTHPIPMLPPPYPGPRHHVMSISSFRNYINTDVYVGKVTSLQSILFYADAILLQRNGKQFGNGPNGALIPSLKFRDRGDKPILRQEPALLRPPDDLVAYYLNINKCNTEWRHGGIHCGLVRAGYDTQTGKVNQDAIRDNQVAIQSMSQAYELDKGKFPFREMYSLLDTDKYEAIYFDKKGNPVKIKHDMDENIDQDHFFQSFVYIFGSNERLQIDILKLISEHRTKIKSPNKKLAVQTSGDNMKRLLSLLYNNPAHNVIGEDGLRKVIQTLNSVYEKGLSKTEIDDIVNISKSGKNISNTRERIWNEIGLRSPK